MSVVKAERGMKESMHAWDPWVNHTVHEVTMKFALIFFAAGAILMSDARAGTIPQSKLIQLCAVGKAANDDGISAKYMIQQMLASRGEPKYLANVFMNEMKPVCPRVY